MKSVFYGTLVLCFMLSAVMGCDQGMNMMKPAVQDAMDTQQEDEPDSDVEQDNETMDTTVADPDVQPPAESDVETPEEPEDTVAETPEEPSDKEVDTPEPEPDPYQLSDDFTTDADGTVTLKSGGLVSIAGPTGGCQYLGGTIIAGGVRYIFHEFKWQTRQNAEANWTDVDSDKCDPDRFAFYGYDLNAADPGQYRAVLDMTTTSRVKLKTNTVIVE